jgi:hypothetical protein
VLAAIQIPQKAAVAKRKQFNHVRLKRSIKGKGEEGKARSDKWECRDEEGIQDGSLSGNQEIPFVGEALFRRWPLAQASA